MYECCVVLLIHISLDFVNVFHGSFALYNLYHMIYMYFGMEEC